MMAVLKETAVEDFDRRFRGVKDTILDLIVTSWYLKSSGILLKSIFGLKGFKEGGHFFAKYLSN